MYYYEVALGAQRYRGEEPLTYHAPSALHPGQLVEAPLQSAKSLGIILRQVTRPTFKTIAITQTFALPALPKQSLQLLAWMRAYYPGPISSHAGLFLPPSLSARTLATAPQKAAVDAHKPPQSLPPLTTEQTAALDAIAAPGTYLLHGETGSGKTRVYAELADRALASGTSAIILTPEIGLTPQLADTFRERFGAASVIVLHSQLSEKTRRDYWLQILASKQPLVIIGPRSSLFVPLQRIGLIVVDESHEFTYKQEQAPHYQTTHVAAKLGSLHAAPVVLGSATPSVVDYYALKARGRMVIRMSEQARGADTPAAPVTIVDMRQKDEQSRDAYLSNSLITAMQETLANKSQTLLFINRRGSARIMLCNACGWQATCPNCDLPLTYHHDVHELRCHICNFKQSSPTSCPKCSNTDIVLKSIGTKLIAEHIEKLFPGSRVARFDTDNLTGERLTERFSEVQSGDIDILVGTQLLTKGLDLPRLALVGVINADASLYIPDYTASERSYQLLHQVIGRVGRGHTVGRAILQSYTPENPTLLAAARHSWHDFYERELAERQAFHFPPFVHLLKLSCKRTKSETAEKAADAFISLLRSHNLQITIDGPAPAFHEKFGGKYHWQVIIKATRRSELIKVISLLPRDWKYDIDPVNLL